ncbi:MAG: 1-phosphofructokinase family hexose kinase [Chloroflexi bacterium]|nr:1-phosphofructokinase family hexose kinase [Chloroflexota bacterium]
MIYTVTLNPTLDKTLSVPRLRPGEVHRARFIRQDIGGKGINVSRALTALGIASRPIGFLGGATGQAMRNRLVAAGYDAAFIEVNGETRQNLTLLDEATGVYTKINEPGPTVGPAHLAGLADLVASLARSGDLWAFSGSLPPGAPDDFYADLIAIVQTAGGLAFLDTSGPALAAGLAARPYGIKPNSEEAAEALGRLVETDEDHVAAARQLVVGQIGNLPYTAVVCLTRAAQGLVLALGDEVVIAAPPPVAAASPVGAGDATLAGLLWATLDGCDAVETARRAVACGTAAAMQEGTGVGERALVEELLSRVRLGQKC